jgi:hypothetical protein
MKRLIQDDYLLVTPPSSASLFKNGCKVSYSLCSLEGRTKCSMSLFVRLSSDRAPHEGAPCPTMSTPTLSACSRSMPSKKCLGVVAESHSGLVVVLERPVAMWDARPPAGPSPVEPRSRVPQRLSSPEDDHRYDHGPVSPSESASKHSNVISSTQAAALANPLQVRV